MFDRTEVEKAIYCLKCGKSGGIDMLIAEIFKECNTILSPVLCKLYDYMFVNGIYPESWPKGIIVPVVLKKKRTDRRAERQG
jgi:hypothetical protein